MVFKKKKNSILAGALAFVLVFNMCFGLFGTSADAVSQSEIDALKQQQEQLAEQKASIQAKADEINGQVASQTEQLDLLNEQLEVTNSELENLTEQIALYTKSIAQMENELNADKEKEQELLAHYKVRIRSMEENGEFAYISILFGAKSFTDLLGRINDIKDIMEYDDNLIKDVQEAQVKVEQAKEDMEAEMAEQQEVFDEYQEKQQDLLEQQQQAETILASLSADSADYQQQLETVNSLKSSIDGQISSMQDQLAEQERLKAEQDAANQIASDNSNQQTEQSGSATGSAIVSYAESFLGVPYVYGGTSPSGFDCSGLVYYCYMHFGYYLNRTAAGLAYNGTAVSKANLEVGDIILFTSTDGSYVGHVGIYIGNGQFIHAPHTGDVVKISSLSEEYYTNHYWGARRIIS